MVNKCVAIEAKSAPKLPQVYAKGLLALGEGLGNRLVRKIVVYTGESKLKTDLGIEVLPVSDFVKLLEWNSLFS